MLTGKELDAIDAALKLVSEGRERLNSIEGYRAFNRLLDACGILAEAFPQHLEVGTKKPTGMGYRLVIERNQPTNGGNQ